MVSDVDNDGDWAGGLYADFAGPMEGGGRCGGDGGDDDDLNYHHSSDGSGAGRGGGRRPGSGRWEGGGVGSETVRDGVGDRYIPRS